MLTGSNLSLFIFAAFVFGACSKYEQKTEDKFSDEIKPVLLICDGKYTDLNLKMDDIIVNGARIILDSKGVELQGAPGFSGEGMNSYSISRFDVGFIGLINAKDNRLTGSLNRLNGEFAFIQHSDESRKRWERMYAGKCKPSERMF